ncbi:unnamed protein product [Leptidea sinapis]|uniref:Uncharacterized protein n=1 Tax=Leptidea sinapis TaxID=189913 RepID=A0A5E4QEQ5_9NEOP|nr:unnamed protein product [Leptidea sinapis]
MAELKLNQAKKGSDKKHTSTDSHSMEMSKKIPELPRQEGHAPRPAGEQTPAPQLSYRC